MAADDFAEAEMGPGFTPEGEKNIWAVCAEPGKGMGQFDGLKARRWRKGFQER